MGEAVSFIIIFFTEGQDSNILVFAAQLSFIWNSNTHNINL